MSRSDQANPNRLRLKAEALLTEMGKTAVGQVAISDMSSVLHDLAVYQIELEMQNEELQKVQRNLQRTQEEYHYLYHHAPIGYLTLDHNGVILQHNKTFSSMLKDDGRRFIGTPFAKLIVSEDQNLFLARYKAFLKRPQDKNIDLRLVRHDKTLLWVRLSGQVGPSNFVNEEDVPTLLMTVTDITWEKIEEQENKNLTDRLLLATSSALLGIWDWDVRENKMVWDDRMFEMYGVSREETPNNIDAWLNGLHPEDKGPALAACQAALDSEKDFDIEFRVLHPDGKVKHLKANGLVVMGADGKPDRMLGINMDITENKKIWDERIRNAQLASLGELAAGVAHEINNPINGVINYAQILLNKEPEDTFSKKALLGIKNEGMRIAGIVKNLLNFVNKNTEEHEFIEIRSLFVEPLNLMMQFFKNENIHIDVHFEKSLPKVYCNPRQVEQVILNLLSNARHALNEKYPNESPKKSIIIDAETVDKSSMMKITIKDMGTGISKDNISRLFEPFFTTKKIGIGTGIGLSISKDILEQNRGQISIESVFGEYTVVTIHLPTSET